MNKTINPELLLAAFRMTSEVKPQHAKIVDGKVLIQQPSDSEIAEYPALIYDPLKNDAWAMRLERALKKEGWVFYQTPKGKYVAFDIHGRPESDDSDTLLLLKCVSAQTGIPLYLEDKQ